MLATTILAAGVCATPGAAMAFDNASSHTQARYGSRTCMVTHSHYGRSPAWPSKRGARKAAIRAWTHITTWEYGKRWGSYRLARGQRMSCNRAGRRWICETHAYPCRR